MDETIEYTDYTGFRPSRAEGANTVVPHVPAMIDHQLEDSDRDSNSTETVLGKRNAGTIQDGAHPTKRPAVNTIQPHIIDVGVQTVRSPRYDSVTEVDDAATPTSQSVNIPESQEQSAHEDKKKEKRLAGEVRRRLNATKAFETKDVLCTACASLDLTVDKFVIDHTGIGRPGFLDKKVIGSFSTIHERRRCPLCRLLVKSMGPIPDIDKECERQSALNATCELYWIVDGRERVSEGDRNQQRIVKRTRRLAIEWSNKPSEKAYIVLVAPEGPFSKSNGSINTNDDGRRPMMFLGRLMTSIDQSSVDLVDHWLKICKEHHEEECQIHKDLKARVEEDLHSPTFTVIDVQEMCLTHLPQDEKADARYLALSYTWGEESRRSGGHSGRPTSSKERFKTEKANLGDLEAKGGVLEVLKGLPMAIQNAIYLTHRLGYRYLWVDSLCIVQDDKDSWDLNAEIMDVVYGNAEFTICAADGDGSEKIGLKALFPPEDSRHARHAEQHTTTYPMKEGRALQLMLSRPSESYIAPSRWNKRAWTFQERLLSRRCLIFVAGRMYLQCRTTTMSEDTYSEYAVAGWSVELLGAPAHTLKPLNINPIVVYKNCLKLYTSRQLTHDEDILSAFNGIANIICSALVDQSVNRCPLVFGLPPSHFDWALLWQPDETPERRLPSKGREFPSWSWAGSKGKEGNKSSYRKALVGGPEINLHEWLMKHTWITYYIRNSRGELRLIWDPSRYKAKTPLDLRWKGYKSPKKGLPGGSGLVKGDEIDVFPERDFHGRPFNKELPKEGRIEHRGHQFLRTTEKFPRYINVLKPGKESRPRTNGPSQDTSLLQFWTWSADFYLGEEKASTPEVGCDTAVESRRLRRFAILDSTGDKVGTCLLDAEWFDAARNQTPQRFIAISDARDFDSTEFGHWNRYTENPGAPWQLYNVMMLSCPDGGSPDKNIAYRAGLGKVYKSAFPNALKYDWKEIILG